MKKNGFTTLNDVGAENLTPATYTALADFVHFTQASQVQA